MQIYDFEQYEPPIINEKILEEKLEKKKTTRNATIVAIAGFLMQFLVLTLSFVVYYKMPLLTVLCIMYVIISIIGSSVISIIYSKKGVITQ